MLEDTIPFKQRRFRVTYLPPRDRIAANPDRIGARILRIAWGHRSEKNRADKQDARSGHLKTLRYASYLGFMRTSGGFRADQECYFPPLN